MSAAGCGGRGELAPLPLGVCEAPDGDSRSTLLPRCIRTARGRMAVESEYLPGVVDCELSGVTLEGAALEAQVIAARTYLAAYLARRGEDAVVPIGAHFQCWRPEARERSRAAARATADVILVRDGAPIRAHYVSGARENTFDCEPLTPAENGYDGYASWDDMRKLYLERRRDRSRRRFGGISWTEVVVTRNEGLAGEAVRPTPMATADRLNRGAFGQYAAVCLARNLGYETLEILRYFYGEDVTLSAPLREVAPVDGPGWADGHP